MPKRNELTAAQIAMYDRIRNNIQVLMFAERMKQPDLAKQAGVNYQTMLCFLNGTAQSTTFHLIAALAKVLEVPIDGLMNAEYTIHVEKK